LIFRARLVSWEISGTIAEQCCSCTLQLIRGSGDIVDVQRNVLVTQIARTSCPLLVSVRVVEELEIRTISKS
jgi:hypothetical protein